MFSTQIVADDETEADNRSKSSDKLSRNTFWAHTEHRQLPETISSFTLWLRWILNVLRNEQSSSGGNSKQTDEHDCGERAVMQRNVGLKKNPVYKSFKSQSL